jgi:hypothetical protein
LVASIPVVHAEPLAGVGPLQLLTTLLLLLSVKAIP